MLSRVCCCCCCFWTAVVCWFTLVSCHFSSIYVFRLFSFFLQWIRHLRHSKKNERYFLAGRKMVDLMEESAKKLTKALASSRKMRGQDARKMQASLDNLRKEAAELQQTMIAVRVISYYIILMKTDDDSKNRVTVRRDMFSLASLSYIYIYLRFHLLFSIFRRIQGNVCDRHWTGHGVPWVMMSRSIRKS